MHAGDTIVALSSGALPSGVAVIRLSGPGVPEIITALIGFLPEPRRMVLASIALGGETIDRGLVAYFAAPHSFTGEHCAELQLHGSLAVVRAVLRQLSSDYSCRLAEAGEFTRRAFENGKLDLTEVEGLGDLILAETENQRKQALARLNGNLSQHVAQWRETLLDLRADIEAQLDFSDEGDVAAVLPQRFMARLGQLRLDLVGALDGLSKGRVVREGLRIALAGAPNAGKSSLLNALARSEVAIVTDEAGTTRDVREVAIDLGGQLVILLDMAGLRDTDSKAEAEGIRRAKQEIVAADLVLHLVAPDVAKVPIPETSAPVWLVHTKADLTASAADLSVSTLTGAGIDHLLERLGEFSAAQTVIGEPALVSRERDSAALDVALTAVDHALARVAQPELAAESLRQASYALEQLIGRIDAEQVLGRLFSAFCIGK